MMMQPKMIDMTRPTALYLGGIAILLLAVFVESRLPVGLSQFVHLPYQRPITAGLFGLSVILGLLGSSRYAARALEPWRVPQAQVFLCFIAFFVTGALAVIFSS